MSQAGGNAVAIVGGFKDLLIRAKEHSSHSKEFGGTPIPIFDEGMLSKLCRDSAALLRRIPTVVEVKAPVLIVGDINGNIFDLIRMTSKCGSFSTNQYVFLGNYIGRGGFSIQVLAYLLGMFCLCPHNVILLRGANEFDDTPEAIAFEEEIREHYGPDTKLRELFHEVFAFLPIACLVNRDFLCVHGGITRRVKTIVQIASVQRPVYTASDPILSDVVAANPHAQPGEYLNSQTTTGDSCNLRGFLEENGLRKIIRSHECVQKGVAASAGGKILTVFSCSNFEGRNKAGVIHINDEGEPRGIAITGIAALPLRRGAVWTHVGPPKKEAPSNPRVFRQAPIPRGGRRKPNTTLFNSLVAQARRSSTVMVKPISVSNSMGDTPETTRLPVLDTSGGQEQRPFSG